MQQAFNLKAIKTFLVPGISNTGIKTHLFGDVLFFLVVIALPTSFFAFLPKYIFYDIRLVYWLLGMIYGLVYFKYITKLSRIKGFKLLFLCVIFLFMRFLYAVFIDAIPIVEVVTIFRTSFHYPITALGFLLYAASMDNKRINRFLYWLYHVTLVLSILYIISNLTGLNFYAVISKEDNENFINLGQNLSAVPSHLNLLFVVGLVAAFTLKKPKHHLLWIVPLLLTILTIVRNQIIVFLIMLLLFVVFGYLYFKTIKFGQVVKIGVLLVLTALVLSFVFSAHINRLIAKFEIDNNEQVDVSNYTEKGTFYFRLQLIEDAYKRIKDSGNLLMGNGYSRTTAKGEYDFVVGGDTYIAPILYTEGFLGLFIRLLPVFFFLKFGFINVRKQKSPYRYIPLIMVIIIIPTFINAVQTKIFVRYTETLFIFYVLVLFIYNQQQKNKLHRNTLR